MPGRVSASRERESPGPRALLPPSPSLEELDRPLVAFGSGPRREGPQVTSFPRPGVLGPRVQSIPAGGQFADHDERFSFSAMRALTSFATSAAGSGWAAENRMLPLPIGYRFTAAACARMTAGLMTWNVQWFGMAAKPTRRPWCL